MPDLEWTEQSEASPEQPRRPGRAALGVVLAVAVVLSLLSFGLVEAAPATDLALYQAIERAFNQLSNEINVSQYGLSSDQVFAVVQQVIDHNPRIIYYDYSNSSLYSDGRLLFRYTEPPTEIRRMWAAYDQAITPQGKVADCLVTVLSSALPVTEIIYNVPMNPDKIFGVLSEPDIIKDRKLSEKKVHIKWYEDNLQLNSKRKLC